MSRKVWALLLNAFVLPGLGQIYLGRKAAGITLILLVNLLLFLALFVLFKGASPLIASRMTSGSLGSGDILAALDSVAGYGRALLTAIALVWIYAIADIFMLQS
jgi:hypothetical protein